MRPLCIENSVKHTQSYTRIPVWSDLRDPQHLSRSAVLRVCTQFFYVQELCNTSLFCSYWQQHNVNTTRVYFVRNDQRHICLSSKYELGHFFLPSTQTSFIFVGKTLEHFLAIEPLFMTSGEAHTSNTNGSSSTAPQSTAQLLPPSHQHPTQLQKASRCTLNPEQANFSIIEQRCWRRWAA